MKHKRIFELAKPYLAKNDFGVAHTQRVFDIAMENFNIREEMEDLVFACLILHDIGGSNVKEQYDKGPSIATMILKDLSYDEDIVQEVCNIIKTHHEHPQNPSLAFRILYDSDKLAMFSEEEFPFYDSRPNFDWDGIIESMYDERLREVAKKLLLKRRE